jgi:hypothetical protein
MSGIIFGPRVYLQSRQSEQSDATILWNIETCGETDVAESNWRGNFCLQKSSIHLDAMKSRQKKELKELTVR